MRFVKREKIKEFRILNMTMKERKLKNLEY